MWGFFVAVAAFAVTLNAKALWISIPTSMVLYIASSEVIFSRKKSDTPS
jgi:Na+-driven multidrug efflux pump